MSAKLDGYTDVITRLAGETVKCSPVSWRRAMLSIQCDGTRITYQLKSDDSPEKGAISEALRDQIDELYVRMRNAGDTWKEAYLHWWREDDDLKFKIDFSYDKSNPAEASSPEPEEKKRRWPWSR
jgi:hypothetical protein